MAHTSKTPSSEIPLLERASFNFFGGSRTSSSVKTQVPGIYVSKATFKEIKRPTPVHAKGTFAARVLEYVDTVERIRVHGGHDESGLVGADWNQAKVERSAEVANLLECRAVGEFGVFSAVIIFALGNFGNSTVASITRKDGQLFFKYLREHYTHPANHTVFPPLVMLHDDHSV